MTFYQKLKKIILDILFPVVCLGCGRNDVWLCQACQEKIPINREADCPICHIGGEGTTCPTCRKKTHLDGLLIAAQYDNKIIQSMIHTFKYSYIKELSKPLASLMVKFLDKFDKTHKLTILNNHSASAVTVVPLHKKRLKERGFNQTQLLAQEINQKIRFNFQPYIMKRTRYTKTQATLNKKQRQLNIKHAFTINNRLNKPLKNVIIIDDVATTLSTLNECALVLKQNGVKNVWGLVIARGGQ